MSYIRQLLIRQALRHKTNRPSGLIGQYKPYLNSNDSPTRDILKDYSGQGHDIQLYNFGWVEESGYSTTNYPGALVSDGVDDHGLCETPFGEVGTVIVMLDEINWETSRYLYDTGGTIDKGRIYCWKSGNITGGLPYKSNIFDGKFTVFTRDPLNVTNKFNLFQAGNLNCVSVALYAMELYSKKLTDEEIQSVKEAMISEYEKETGNVLEGV